MPFCFLAFSLALHFITVYLLCHGMGLLLAGGDMLNSPEKWEMREKAETIMGQAGMFRESVHRFLLSVCHYNRNFSYNQEIYCYRVCGCSSVILSHTVWNFYFRKIDKYPWNDRAV